MKYLQRSFIVIVKTIKACICMCAGKQVKLSLAAEEVALFFAQMLDHDYTTKTVFQENFFTDWRKVKPTFGRKN